MKLLVLTQLIWTWYQNGRVKANDQKLTQADIEQKIKTNFSDLMRQRYYESKQADAYGEPDYSFSSPILAVKRFELPEPDKRGMRRVDLSEWDMYRLPKNSHIPNVYPVGSSCDNEEVGEVTQVNVGEANFYIGNPDMNRFKFFVVSGPGINTYNIPACVKNVDVEATFDAGEDTDVDLSIASIIVDQVLGVALGIKKQYYSEDVRKEMESQNLVK